MMSRSGQSPWERVLRDLHREFSLLERGLSLLQDIDQSILSMGADDNLTPLEDLFVNTTERFSKIQHTEFPLLCYVSLDSEFVRLRRRGPVAEAIESDIPDFFKARLTWQDPIAIHVTIVPRDEDEGLFSYFPGMQTILLCPMFSEWKQLICVFLIADTHTVEGSHLNDQAFGNSVVALVSQLAIAYSHHDRALQHGWIKNLWNTFLESNLSPTKCFKEIARQIPSFLPTFGPIEYRGSAPQVQILMLNKDPDPDSDTPKQLVIRGTTGKEHPGTRIAIERSISGLLVKPHKKKLPYFCDDPSKPKYRKLYKDYLGKGKTIRTELAVRLQLKGRKPVGVLNLESEDLNAFNVHHRAAVLRLSEMIAPIVTVFEQRLGMNSKMQLSVASSTERYLDGIASVYRHSMKTPLTALHANIEMASGVVQTQVTADLEKALKLAAKAENAKLVSILNVIAENLKRTGPQFNRLLATHSQISKYNEDFLRDISGYAETGPMDLRATLDAAVKLVTESLLARLGQQVSIKFIADETLPTTRVYCSPLLKQHLYSIFHNAVLAIQERINKDPNLGIISIGITEEAPLPSKEVQLNTSWAVSILDNGGGVGPEELEGLRRFEAGVRFRKDRSGQGFGLVAAQRFMTSIGGRVELNAELGKGFEVILHFLKERPNI